MLLEVSCGRPGVSLLGRRRWWDRSTIARSTAFLNTETTEDGGRVDAKGQAVRPVHVAPTDKFHRDQNITFYADLPGS